MMYLDYSQTSKWLFCPWAWVENYLNGYVRRYDGQRSDPLCLGSLVHEALDAFSKTGRPIISEKCIVENQPTPETVALANLLVEGYINRYPSERWPVEATEQPLTFPLVRTYEWVECIENYPQDNYDGLAKLDGYFYVPEDTTVESGIEGETLTLSRGWWGREYKTKSAGRPRPEWVKEWQTKRQADFQILALQEYLQSEHSKAMCEMYGCHQVQGILICVLEKPRDYTPKRKCSGCSDTYELSSYLPTSEGFMCPVCGKVQQLKRYEPKVPRVPAYFRIVATRTPEQLAVAREEMIQVAVEMDRVRRGGKFIPNRDNCVNNAHRRICEYFHPHTYGGTTSDSQEFVQIDPLGYTGIREVENEV